MFVFKRFSVALLLAFVLSGCEKPVTEVTSPQVRPAKIFEVTGLSQQMIRNFPAEVEANVGSQLAFRVSGELVAFIVKPGQEVEAGQLLAQLDPKDFKLQLDASRARYKLAQSQFDRTKTLLKKKLISQAQFDETKANMLIALSDQKKAEADLKYTELRAPYAGVVSQVYAENHENIQAKQNVLMLQSREFLDVSIQVPEKLVARVKKDLNYQPSVTFDAAPKRSFLLSIKEWDTQADPITLTYKVVFSMPVPEGINVLPGMSAYVQVDLSKVTDLAQGHFTVPVEAVFSPEMTESQQYVWKYVPDTGKVHLTRVEVGNIHRNGIEVIKGLVEGDQIVSAGVHFLEEGMQIRPWSREGGL